MQTIGNRICEIRRFYFGSDKGANKEFAAKLGVSPNVTSNWCGRKDGIGDKVINQILAAFPDIDRGWLLGGNGEMLSTNSEPPVNLLNTPIPMESAAETDENTANVGKLANSFEELLDKYEDMTQQRDYWRNKATELEYKMAKSKVV